MGSNARVLQRATTDKASVGSTALLPIEQAEQFFDKVMDSAPTIKVVRQEKMRNPTKRINKMTIGERMLRKATENVAPTVARPLSFDTVDLTAHGMIAAIELTKQVVRDNLERQAFAQHVVTMSAERIGLDMNDILWNGDTTNYSAAATTLNGGHNAAVTTLTVADASAFPASSGGYGFLVCGSERISYTGKTPLTFTGCTRGADATTAAIHGGGDAVTFVQDALYPTYNGVLARITTSGTVVDGAAINSGNLAYDHFDACLDAVPAKYRQNNKFKPTFRWFCNDKMARRWEKVLTARMTAQGDKSITQAEFTGPRGFPFHLDEALADGLLVFGPTAGIIQAMRVDNIEYGQTSEGKDLLSRRVTYHQWEVEADVALDEGEMFARVNSINV